MRRILLILLFLILSGNICAFNNPSVVKEISIIYNKLSNSGDFTEYDFKFIQELPESDVYLCSDSTIYQYHYLYGSWLDETDGDLKDRLYHVSSAIKMVEHSKSALEYGVFNIEYLWLLKASAGYYEEQGNIEQAILQYERTLMRGRMLDSEQPNKNLRRVKSGCLQSLGELYAKKGYEREAITVFRQAFDVAQVDYIPNTGDTEGYFPLWSLGNYYLNTKKDYQSAIKIWLELLSFFDSTQASNTPEYASVLFFLGASYGHINDYDSAIEAYLKSIEISNANGIIDENISSFENLFCKYAEVGDMKGFTKMKEFFRDYYSSNPLEYYNSFWAASTLLPMDKLAVERQELTKLFNELEISQQIRLLLMFANADIEINPNQALQYAKQAEESIANINAPGWRYQIAITRASIYESIQDFNNAIIYLNSAETLLLELNDVTLETQANLLFRIANNSFYASQYLNLIKAEERLIPIVLKLYGNKSSAYVQNLNLLGIGLMYSGKHKKALQVFNEALQIIDETVGQDHFVYATNLHNIGRTYMLKGDKNIAVSYFLRAKELQMETNGTIDTKTNQYLNELGIYE